jgi:biotin operon repressor
LEGAFLLDIETITYHSFRLLAIFLGHLRMNVEEAIEALQDIALAIFSDGHLPSSDPEIRTRQLGESVKSILQSRGISPDRKMQETSGEFAGCKVYV